MKRLLITLPILALLNLFFQLPAGAQEPVTVPLDGAVSTEIPTGYSKLRIAGHVGGGWRPARVVDADPVVEDHLRKLKWGYSYGADAAYYFNDALGAGIRFSQMRSSHGLDVMVTDKTTGARRYGRLEENVSMTFLGPVFAMRLLGKNKLNAFVFNVGIGYLGYRDTGYAIDPVKITGGTVGFVTDIGYDLALSKQVSLGAMLSAVTGTLSEATYTENGVTKTRELDKDNREGLGHITLSLGLRINL